jgi:hypothetical protein
VKAQRVISASSHAGAFALMLYVMTMMGRSEPIQELNQNGSGNDKVSLGHRLVDERLNLFYFNGLIRFHACC